jgi:sodium/proline symporter
MVKKSATVAIVWVIFSLGAAILIGMLGRFLVPELVAAGGQEKVFINIVRLLFPGGLALISGILLSAILAAAMSTADSQLLVASSSFTSDIYKTIIRKDADDKTSLLTGRIIVIIVSVVAFFIAAAPGSGTIMSLVENAWAGFGASFGPVIILSLFWKRLTYKGAIAGIVGGGLTVVLWLIFLSATTGVYELLPGFIVGTACAIIGSLVDKKPSDEVIAIFERATDNSIDD